ncbi:2-hydroxycarboxylate transporter family protein [Mesoplasma melaleucae]|uniref:Citrate:sodium symporter n=1 Tax=Mesoplasma melaleucae TaxID=81459 RepID=A0A2K8NY03_9MOLU|nr:2-hydroxycarboxylate transporter family protein [Mesoplasma melaleucae]ATZ17631.1 citrate:sodium symporter [Mesoplasma melaleucae]
MEFMFTPEEMQRFQLKKEAGQAKIDKSKVKLNKIQEKNELIIEKHLAKENLRHTKELDKLETKRKKKLSTLSTKNVSIEITDEIVKFYDSKIAKENELYKIAIKNLTLAKQDLLNGIESSNANNIKVYLESINVKISKVNWKRNWKKLKEKELTKDKKEATYKLYEESDKKYKPLQIKVDEMIENFKLQWSTFKLKTEVKINKTSQYTWKDWINVKIWTIPAWLAFTFLAIIITAILTKSVESNMIYAPAILLIIAVFAGSIFSKIPVWKKYFGGAVMGSMFIAAFLVYFNVLGPEANAAGQEVYASIKAWFKNQDFLSLYISVLLVGAVLLMPRKLIIKATGGFLVIIVAGSLLGLLLAMMSTLVTGMSMQNLILNYTLPILADGNGGGIQPIGKIAEANGYDSGVWMSRALAISTLASILSVIAAAIVSGIGKSKPSLSGNGKLMLTDIHTVYRTAKVNDRNIAAAFLLILVIYIASDILAKAVFTEARVGILIPNFAWMIILCLLANLLDVVPLEMRLGAEKINKFISKQTTWLLMVGVGILFIDLKEFISALNPTSILVCVLFVLGAVVGPMLLAKVLKFNCVEAAVSAGLCMTAQGGSGAIAVLGTSERMNLMPFGQITCRIAGSLILVFAAIAFSKWPGPNPVAALV